MPVDRDIHRLLLLIESIGSPTLAEAGVEFGRERFRQLTLGGRTPENTPRVGGVREITVAGGAGELGARVYTPEDDAAPHPIVAFFHGGGWTIGDLDTHDAQARHLCRQAGAIVVSVDYRLAPEHPFPAAVEDALAATAWISEHAAELGGDPERLAVAGDSAGGNLSAVVCQLAHDEDGRPPIAAQLLIYPGLDFVGVYASRDENGEGHLLTAADMAFFSDQYLPDPAAGTDLRASPILHPDLSGLPPAIVVTAGFDPLRDEGRRYADALGAAGVPVIRRHYDSLIHGFFDLDHVSRAAAAAIAECCADLRALLAAPRAGLER